MFKKLLQFEIYYQLKQRAFPLFALLFLGLGYFIGSQGHAPTGVNFNAVYQVYFHTGLFTLGSVFIIMFFTVTATIRDKQHHMEGLIYSSSITKQNYFWSRFLGTFIFSVLAFSPFIVGYILGNYFSSLDEERLGTFSLLNYIQPWFYIVLPNIFICTSLIFSVSVFTKNSIATYASAVCIYMLYFVSSIFLNSPLLAQSVPASPEMMSVAAIADSFGIAAFFEQTQYWTAYQKNTQLLSFSGLFLLNRALWIAFSLGILFLTYKSFSFRKMMKKVKKEKTLKNETKQLISYKPINGVYNFKAQIKSLLSLIRLELNSVFRSLPFLVIVAMWLLIVFSELYANVVEGREYGVSIYPLTNQLIELITSPLTLFGLLLLIFYGSEIVWREHSMNFNLIIDATPVKNWVFFVAKLISLLLLPILLIALGVLICIAFQVSLGFTGIDLGMYASVFYYYGIQLTVYAMLAIFINGIAKSKYVGMGVFGLLVAITMKANLLGLEHPLTSIGLMPRVNFGDMTMYNSNATLFNHLALYWLSLGALLGLIAFKIWNRGIIKDFSYKIKQLKEKSNRVGRVLFLSFLLLAVGAGSMVFYNTNIVSTYQTDNDDLNFSENYERKYKHYQELEKLYPISQKTTVAIFPKERKYTIKANYVLKNKSDKALSKLLITERIPVKHINIENTRLMVKDTVNGAYVFEFKKKLQPNDSVQYTFTIEKEVKGYEEDKSIVHNGTYITSRNFEPIIGYAAGLEIADRTERKKRGLPEREEEDDSDAHIALEDIKIEKVQFETVVSTSNDQTAISLGELIRTWSENNRNYYHYKSKGEIFPIVAYFSAKYETQKTTHKGIAVEQYYNPSHNFNINTIENSTKEALAYCQENFGSYNFNHVRIAEVPSHWGFGGFAHPGVISMTEDRLYLSDIRDENTFNLVAKRTIHEVAHQWWGHTLTAKPVAGGSLLVEGLAKYTEGVVLEKMYGKRALYELAEDARRRYFLGRAFGGNIEPPIYKVQEEGYISYGKAYTMLMALRDLIGEKQVNKVLKNMTEKHRLDSTPKAHTIELLEEIYKITPEEYHQLVNDWFKRVITYDIAVEKSLCKKLSDGTYEVKATIKAKRFETLSDGDIKEIGINEPIKIGIFTTHPSLVKDNNTVLFYESKQLTKELTEVLCIVNEKPNYIAIDPYGTRNDENLVDNVVEL
ncbi:M1 family aminopeptidase [Tenacibaculum sp.]|uniref:ABC transporter permease/M1 family aminopeptidase n=1 Tax=Tenacibaculum sp. TaxID=1906242 RepID=UPI003AA93F15